MHLAYGRPVSCSYRPRFYFKIISDFYWSIWIESFVHIYFCSLNFSSIIISPMVCWA